ncbi:MAG TPA: hypothetical protein PLN31_17220 [Azoarcus taiwanensis]|nr:hypothetical protein [Azoarcus taiwanensis]
MTDRAALIHYARVLLQQSRHFTAKHRGWSFTLLAWAGRARRHAATAARAVQMEMF